MRISDWSSDVCSSDLVAIARAVIGRPELLVADEPTGNVDQDMAFRLMHLFDELNRLGTTVLVATHDPLLMSRVPSARTMRLERGRLVNGDTRDIAPQPPVARTGS